MTKQTLFETVATAAKYCRWCRHQSPKEQAQCRQHWMKLSPELLAIRHADALDAWRRSGEVYLLHAAGWELIRTTSGRTGGQAIQYLYALPGGGYCQISTFAGTANGWQYSVGKPRKWHV